MESFTVTTFGVEDRLNSVWADGSLTKSETAAEDVPPLVSPIVYVKLAFPEYPAVGAKVTCCVLGLYETVPLTGLLTPVSEIANAPVSLSLASRAEAAIEMVPFLLSTKPPSAFAIGLLEPSKTTSTQ